MTSTVPEPGERIARFLSRAGVASRREAERLIAHGMVTVNGEFLTSPAVKVTPEMDIRVDGTRVAAPAAPRVWRYHKPPDLVCTHNDPGGRATVFDAVSDRLPRVISVGRLDLTSEGLLLLTTSGDISRHMELPSTGWKRRYRVRAHGTVTQDALDRLAGGVTVDGVTYAPVHARIDQCRGSNVWVRMSLTEGRNREVRHIMRFLGLHVNRLIRISYGPFHLGSLARGAVEEIPAKQLGEQLGGALCRKAGL